MSTVPQTAGASLWNPQGQMGHVLGDRVVIVSGKGANIVTDEGRTLLDATASLWWVRLAMFGAGLCNGANMMAVQAAMFTHISKADTTHASAIYNTQRQASIAAVVAILTTIVAAVGGAPVDGFRAAFVADAVIALLGAVAAWTLVRTNDARATMRPARP